MPRTKKNKTNRLRKSDVSTNESDEASQNKVFLLLDEISGEAKCTVMGGQQVCNQACRPCNDG